MVTPSEKLNNEFNQEDINDAQENGEQMPTDTEQTPVDNPETTVPPAPPIEPTSPVETELPNDFNPNVYLSGVAGDERYRGLNLLMGYFVGQRLSLISVRGRLWDWNPLNQPPLPLPWLMTYIKDNWNRWFQYHQQHTWRPSA